MKKFLFSVAFIVTSAIAFAQTAIPNGSFENWNAISIEHPKYYGSSNYEVIRNKLPFNAEKSTSAYHGSYALKLSSVANEKDSMFGYIVNSSTEDDPDKWHGGAPISEKPNGIRGYYKANLTAGDTAMVVLAFSKAGVNIGTYVYKIYNQASNYTLFNYTLSPALSQTPDSVAFAVVSSNPFLNKMIVGSVLYIDSVSLTGINTQPIQLNGDFETWETEDFDQPQKWYVNIDRTLPKLKTALAYKGQYAVKLETILSSHDGKNVARGGYMSTGYYPENCNPCNQLGGFPFSRITDTLSFWYKYAPTANGKAFVRAVLKKNGIQIWSNQLALSATANYQYVDMPIFSGQTPDSIIIEISSNLWEDTTVDHVGSVLIIDELQLKSEPLKTGMLNNQSFESIKVFPNPASQYLSIDITNNDQINNSKLILLNTLGQLVLEQPISHTTNMVDVRNLPSGIYLYSVESDGEKLRSGRLIIR